MNSLVLNRQQGIISTNVGLVWWCIYASLHLSEIIEGSCCSAGHFKNVYELLNLRALKMSMLKKNHIFQCMGGGGGGVGWGFGGFSYAANFHNCRNVFMNMALHWRHNDHYGVSNHQPHGCLLNCLFRRRSKKTSKLRVTGLYAGKSPGQVNSPHKGPVTRKMFPFGDVIMGAILIWS